MVDGGHTAQRIRIYSTESHVNICWVVRKRSEVVMSHTVPNPPPGRNVLNSPETF